MIGLHKLSHDDDDREQFAIVYRDDKHQPHEFGYLQPVLGPVSEDDVRAFFDEGGYPAKEVETMLRVARAAFGPQTGQCLQPITELSVDAV